jgi:hypothetical protein
MIEHIPWALTVLAVAVVFFHLGWVLHRDRFLLRFPRRPTGRRR